MVVCHRDRTALGLSTFSQMRTKHFLPAPGFSPTSFLSTNWITVYMLLKVCSYPHPSKDSLYFGELSTTPGVVVSLPSHG